MHLGAERHRYEPAAFNTVTKGRSETTSPITHALRVGAKEEQALLV